MEIKNYKIILTIDREKHTYLGNETIIVSDSLETINLNSVGLEIESVKVNEKEVSFTLNSKEGILSIPSTRGKVSMVQILFSGKITRLLTGFYVSNGPAGEVFTTQFEPAGARRAFPCVDDPNFKATFDIEVQIDKELEAISNMPIETTTNLDNDKKNVRFMRTPRMSTYLVYLAVGKFETRILKRKNMDLLLTAQDGTLTKSNFPLDIAAKVLDFLEDYFGIELPISKIHLISVPDTGGGAMENWGAIKFSDRILTIDSASSISDLMRSANVIAHELAHQWFGDLVTMKWWNDLWLNESFATFLAYKTMSYIEKDWNYTDEMIISRMGSALWMDALETTHAIDTGVTDPEQISQLAKEIRYDKGASVLRMLENYIGEENFRKGISTFLEKYKYKNATGSELWRTIEESVNIPITEFMESWLKKTGYPVVIVDKNNKNLMLTQKRFLFNNKSSVEWSPWQIPIFYNDETGVIEKTMMNENNNSLPNNVVNVNADRRGFYRVFYNDDLYEKVLLNTHLSEIDLWGLCSDAFAQFVSSRISFKDYILKLKLIMDRSPNLVIREIIRQFNQLYIIAPTSLPLKKEILNFAHDCTAKLGMNKSGEPPERTIARSELQKLLVMADDEYAKELSEKFTSYYSIDANDRESVALAYARTGGLLPEILSVLRSASNVQDRERLIVAMGWLDQIPEVRSVVSMVKNGDLKRTDIGGFVISAAESPISRGYIRENLNSFLSLALELMGDNRMINKIVEASIPIISIAQDNRIEDLIGTNIYNNKYYEQTIKRTEELVNIYRKIAKSVPV